MKSTMLLVLAFSCCVCEPESAGNGDQLTGNGDLVALVLKVTNMADKIALLEAKLLNAEKEIKELRNITTGGPRVAFSATLSDSERGDTGPFTAAVPLQYRKVFANAGNCYNRATGIFTAQVRGMYYFRYSMFANLGKPNSVVSLRKNGERLNSVWDTSTTDGNDNGSNAVVIDLEVGDSVYVELQAGRKVYDDAMHYNTFSGFLLFTM
ncbi:complement C1q-like protein 2 isoform X3 [Sardina pilchardus]|uniref:complement C1q-like protein 2 isoform X1 n=1 Tax=Sardina pilchardus TaxID=27697 RepID=UPI002E160B1A